MWWVSIKNGIIFRQNVRFSEPYQNISIFRVCIDIFCTGANEFPVRTGVLSLATRYITEPVIRTLLSFDCSTPVSRRVLKGRLNTDTAPQNLWTSFLANDLTEKFKKSAVASAIAIPLPLCFSCFVPIRRFRENLTKPFYFYLSRTCDSPSGTPSVISLALRTQSITSHTSGGFRPCATS